MSFHIMNSDLMDFGYRPSQTKVGDVISVTKDVQACQWKTNSSPTIKTGKYKIVSRKGFVGGSQEIEAV